MRRMRRRNPMKARARPDLAHPKPSASVVPLPPSRRSLRIFVGCVAFSTACALVYASLPTPIAEPVSYRAAIPETEQNAKPLLFSYEVVNRFEHDPRAFTQGLEFERVCEETDPTTCQDVFLESTGMFGESTVRRVDVESGAVLSQTSLAYRDFGEGLTRFGDEIYQLTWRQPTVFVYNNDLQQVDVRQTGLRDDSGSELYFLDPITLEIQKQLTVTFNGKSVRQLNELEWIHGKVWANIWYSDCIAMIDPITGHVEGLVNLANLTKEVAQMPVTTENKPNVLNGIAYDREGNRLFVTGKWWPKMFEIKLLEPTKLNRASKREIQRVCRL